MRKPAIMFAAVAAAIGGVVSLSSQSGAEQSFTLAMKDGAREAWNERLNETIAEPFSEVAVCKEGADMDLKLGEGCVEAASVDICCKRWTIAVECTSENAWEQQSIRGSSCTKRPHEDED